MNNELMHYGVRGMKWGVQKKTTGLKARGQRAGEQYLERGMARRSRFRETINGGDAGKALRKVGLLGVAAIKSKRFNAIMNEKIDRAEAIDQKTLSDLKAGKQTADTFVNKFAAFNVVDLAMVNVRDRDR